MKMNALSVQYPVRSGWAKSFEPFLYWGSPRAHHLEPLNVWFFGKVFLLLY